VPWPKAVSRKRPLAPGTIKTRFVNVRTVFKAAVREQYFSLVLDPEGALAAIPAMLPTDAAKRKRILEAIRRTADAAGTASGEGAVRLAKLEELFASGARGATARKAPRKAARRTKS